MVDGPPNPDPDTGPLAGQSALITGGARGIGFTVARRLAVDGARVAILDADSGALAEAQTELAGEGASVVPLEADVSEESSVGSAVGSLLQGEDRLDILVNNAGIFPHTPFEQLTFAEWRRVLTTNLDSVFLCTRAVYPSMVSRRYGRIVNMSSATFFIGYPEMTAYIASKAGIIGFTRALASEAGPHGITVNAVTPGLIETEGAIEEDPTGELFDEIVGGQAVKRRGLPNDIAECIAYLVRPSASFVTGQTINVDGGHRYH